MTRGLLFAALFAPIAYLLVSAATVAADHGGLDVAVLPLLGRTIGLAFGASGVALVSGGVVAMVFEARAFPAPRIFRVLAFAPLLLPPVFQVAVWERLAEPGGLLCTLLPFAVESDKPFPIRNFTSAVILLGLNYSPITFFFLSHALRAIPNELLTAARLHSGSWRSYWRVQLPLAMPSFLAGAGLTFTFTFLSYEVPRLLEVTTYPVLVNTKFEALNSPGLAFLFAIPCLCVSCSVLLGSQAWANRERFALSGRERGELRPDQRKPGLVAWIVFLLWWSICSVLPFGLLVTLAASLSTFVRAFHTDWERILSSAFICFSTAVVAAALAGVALLPVTHTRRRVLVAVLWLPVALPGTLLGMALVHFRGVIPEWTLPVYDGWWILVVGGVLRFFPLAYFALQAHLRTIPDHLWKAAELHGTDRERILRLDLPLAWPGLVTGAVAVGLFASQELASTILLAPPGHEPLIVRIYNLLHYDPEGDALAALCLFHVLSIVFVMLIFLFVNPWKRPRSESVEEVGSVSRSGA